MSSVTFLNATIFTGDRLLPNVSVRVVNGRIDALHARAQPGDERVDLQGDYLVPGLVDLQLYGGSRLFLNEFPTADTVRHIYETHRQNGTTSVVPTLYSTAHTVILQAIDAVRTVRQENPHGVLGLHVEGPYLNPVRRGAHSARYVRPPDAAELDELFSRGGDAIKLMTLAPEVFPAERLAQLLRLAGQTGTLLSLGHSDATYRQATDAFNGGIPLGGSSLGGIPLATHLYNAMRPFESREPGVVGAIFDHPNVRVSLIADGFHCDPAAIRLAHRVLGPDRLFLISDATFAHPPMPAYAHEDFSLRYDNGRYLNPEGKLAGSSITLLDAVRVCVEQAGLPLPDVLRMATSLPADIAGVGDRLGRIEPGYVANLVRLDKSLSAKAVWTNGVKLS